jgi:hypothetical protein
MSTSPVQLAKDLHRRMGYPLGKVHYGVESYFKKWGGYGSPLRHVRRISFKARNLKNVLERKRTAQTITRNLKPEIAARVKEFQEQGFAYISDLVDQPLLAELGTRCDEMIRTRSESAKSAASHPFFFPLTKPEDYTTDNILLRFALHDSVMQIVSAHFGSVPFLYPISVQESRYVKIEKKKQRASQQWHLDYTDVGDDAIALWVYLTDVPTIDQGPLTILPIPSSKKVKNSFFHGRIEDEQIEAAGLNPEIHPILGPKLSVFLVNTYKCYHMGSRCKEGNRRVVAIFPFMKSADADNFVKITAPVTDAQKLVVRR